MQYGLGNIVYDPEVQNWLLFAVILILALIVAKMIHTFIRFGMKKVALQTRSRLDDIIVDAGEGPFVFLFFLVTIWFALPLLSLPGETVVFVYNILKILIVLTAVCFIGRLSDKLIEMTVRHQDFDADTPWKKSLPAFQKLFKVALFIIAALVIFEILGFDIWALLAGLGLGGLAVALAAKDTLANMFGSLTVLADRPFKMGDRIKFDRFEGKVEEIGLRSTKIKTDQNTEVTIPNANLAIGSIENITQRQTARQDKIVLKLDRSLNSEQIRQVLDLVQEIFRRNEHIAEHYQVAFVEITSIGFVIAADYRLKNRGEALAVKEDLNFSILRELEKKRIKLA